MANPNSLMNRSKSLADKKNAIDKKMQQPKNVVKKKKLKFNSFLPFEPENSLDEDLKKEKEYIQKAFEQK